MDTRAGRVRLERVRGLCAWVGAGIDGEGDTASILWDIAPRSAVVVR